MKETIIQRMNQKLSLIPKLTVITNQRLVLVEELMWDSTLTGQTIGVRSLFMADVMATETTLSLLSLVPVLVTQNSLVLHPSSQFLTKITEFDTFFSWLFCFFFQISSVQNQSCYRLKGLCWYLKCHAANTSRNSKNTVFETRECEETWIFLSSSFTFVTLLVDLKSVLSFSCSQQ